MQEMESLAPRWAVSARALSLQPLPGLVATSQNTGFISHSPPSNSTGNMGSGGDSQNLGCGLKGKRRQLETSELRDTEKAARVQLRHWVFFQ